MNLHLVIHVFYNSRVILNIFEFTYTSNFVKYLIYQL